MTFRTRVVLFAASLVAGGTLAAQQTDWDARRVLPAEKGGGFRFGDVPRNLPEVRPTVRPETHLIDDLQTAPASLRPIRVEVDPQDELPVRKKSSSKKSKPRYQIIQVDQGTLLLDSHSGRTWLLTMFPDRKPVWSPIEREDD